MDRELVDWFREEDEGDQPELHLVGLTADEVVRCFDEIARCRPVWSDQTLHIDAEGVDATVPERPDVAQLVVGGRVSPACIGARLTVGGIELPEIAWFMWPTALEFFWDLGPHWTEERVRGFLVLIKRLLAVAPNARVVADPRYGPDAQRRYDTLVRRALDAV